MKLILNLCGIALAGFLGYALEPNLRSFLVGPSPGVADTTATGRVIVQMGEGAEKVDLENLTREQLPEVVRINAALQVEDSATGITMNIPAGNNVNLVGVEGAIAVVSQAGSYVGRIPVMDTDLLQRLSEMPPVTSTAPEPTPPATSEIAAPSATPEPTPVPDPAPTQPESDPFGEPAAPAEPEAPAAEPDAPAGDLAAPSDVVQTMQASVKSGQIKEFKFDQVTEWKAGEPEAFEGEMFQTGTALYTASTVLGEKSIQAKALIKDGKVQRWVWLRNGMEIK